MASYNNSHDDDDIFQQPLWKNLNILCVVIHSIAFVLGVIGNGLIIFITGFRMKKTVNIIWFLNLAIADFTFTFFLPLRITYLAMSLHWPFGEAMCKLNSSLAFVNFYASIYLLMVISIDRCISVLCPAWAQNHRNPRCASFVALGVWILALVLSSPEIHFKKTTEDNNQTYCYSHYSHDEKQAEVTFRDIIISRFIFAFAIPFLVILICYGTIVLRLRRVRSVQSSKPFKVITAVIVAFFICWLPYHVFSFLELQFHKDPTQKWIPLIGVPLATSLGVMNSCLNPILYVFMGHDFKERLKHSILAAFETVFAENGRHNTTQTKAKSSVDLDAQDL
ncbi:chemerin-like receptor 1 [Heteronotia binoei]|uniref:chemerin-like receptor 1 n=1 Tax=Heteronotia binoei TaxID=13085 RepID=UPI0029307EA3|nr:chemerin-like receptor 1 [Heteronotia binoei]